MASTLKPGDPEWAQFENVLTIHKNAIQKSSQRKGEQPKDHTPRAICLHQQSMAVLSSRMRQFGVGHELSMSVIGELYPPSIASFETLQKLMIKDLRIEVHHRGFYLLLRFIHTATRMTAVMNVVEDETEAVMLLSLYLQLPESIRPAESILKDKSVIILKEPYFKVATGGGYLIRVDQPTDIVWLADDDSRIPEKWRKPNVSNQQSADYWKKRGNELVGKDNFFEAIEMYSRALRSSPTPAEQEVLHNNRALANLRIEAFDAALSDVSFVSNPNDRSEKGLYRGALALYGLGRFKEGHEILRILIDKYPNSTTGKQELERTRLRLLEQENGAYDFETMYKATKLRPLQIDCATFRGPVEIRESKGRGRGLFTTKSVSVGDLLLCEKAFSYCFAPPEEEMDKLDIKSFSRSSLLVDVPNKRMSLGTHADLIRDVSNKLALNPSLQQSFEDLFHGEYDGVKGSFVDGCPVVDAFRVATTIHHNCFGSPLTSRDTMDDAELNRISGYQIAKQPESTHFGTTGMWILASYINHSCNPTCVRNFIGDMQIVRAARDMPANMELTFSYLYRDESPNMIDVSSWGFQCDCSICVEDSATSAAVKMQRRKLHKVFALPIATLEKKEETLKQFANTYKQPPSEVPRLGIIIMHNSLIREFAQRREVKKAVDQVLATFESLGFIIEGVRGSSSQGSKIIVRRWGFPHNGTTSLWLTLRDVYKSLGKNELADQTEKFARISWMLRVGEDTTFVF
ncbi:hypothetical protein HYFRA_00000358 [Hymenoscyphus fraxineus]|uniref:SET domain-containing protein n=1 Tax=Hymenoscyphus fraxineus TaxID=746836 RepID=A0A9N9L0P8_9HELO|nr:hypothetical protein HYFRA_00000358 [Hymenoscyphus fraxineus]